MFGKKKESNKTNKKLSNRSAGQQPDFSQLKGLNFWRVLGISVILGLGFNLAFAATQIIWSLNFKQNFYVYVSSLGILWLTAGACYFAGGLVGFLFGIPRIIQNASGNGESDKAKRGVSQNDNLVQISDWITKIIVGVGLTQLYNIPHFLLKTGTQLSYNYFGTSTLSSRNAAIVTILYFSIVGFISIYLWTRIYFTQIISELEKDLDGSLREDVEDLKSANNQLQEASAGVGGGKKVSLADLSEIKAKAQTELSEANKTKVDGPELKETDFYSDPQKGKWGGLSETNGRRMSATVVPTSTSNFYLVTITVESIDTNNPLMGYVKFYLHPTFRNPNPVIACQDNKAVLRLNMVYGAFTVGAELDDGNTTLELDLAELPNAPKEFKDR